ncbi:hypothetical protein V1512DRAFT_273816 [Lipomyces arxii]|uniref:uncharacterized protein n=1 Tax=Lipomyces arxii TaxID=56418 RepID=UPI0034CE4D38
MGVIVSTPDESGGICIKDKSRCTISKLDILTLEGRHLMQISPTPDSTSVVAVREENAPMIEYVQDLEPQTSCPILLKLSNENGLVFKFSIVINKAHQDQLSLDGLTYISSANTKTLDSFLKKDLHSNPNVQERDNVVFMGDYSVTNGEDIYLDWSWTWTPPADMDLRFNGWRNTCCFAEYSKRDHQFHRLAEFSFWVQDAPRSVWTVPPSPGELNLAQFKSHSSGDESSAEHDLLPSAKIVVNDGYGDIQDTYAELKPLSTTNSTSTAPTSIQPPVQRALPEPNELTQPEDGPLFRATVTSLEKKTSSLKVSVKKILKLALQIYDAQRLYCESYAAFIESLKDPNNSMTSFRPVVDNYFRIVGVDLLRFEQLSCMALQANVISPLQKLYEVDIKAADSKKREFDDESREYYAWLGRYLSKKSDNDSKYQDKRKAFELRRFDYYSYIQDLHGGRKEQEVSYQLSLYAAAVMRELIRFSKTVQMSQPQIESMMGLMRENHEAWSIRRTEREERRRALEMSTMSEASAAATQETVTRKQIHSKIASRDQLPPLNTTLAVGSNPQSTATAISATSQQRFKGIRDLEERDESISLGRRKEGLLWAMSRPHTDPRNLNMAGWHKFWVVLAKGQLYEYSNWKQSLELHTDPVNLKMASVREARGSERRFCFEVITPQYRRVYQATSEEDMQSWITVISNAITSMIEGSESVRSFQLSPEVGPVSAISLPPAKSTFTPISRRDGTLLRSYDEADENELLPLSSASSGEMPPPGYSLIERLRDADPANSQCADCGSVTKVEWVSINLMTVLCIECSGLHRSLGTHISKVRSLKLDTVSFTPDLVDALVAVGNTTANSVWEAATTATDAKLNLQTQLTSLHQPQQPCTPTAISSGGQSSRQARLDYITKKYVDRAFVQSVPNPSAALRLAVKTQNIADVVRTLASSAEVLTNPVSSSGASFSSSSSSVSSAGPVYPIVLTALVYADRDAHTFPIAELLIQNGAPIPIEVPPEIRLTRNGQKFLNRKSGKTQVNLVPESDSSPSSVTSSAEQPSAPRATGSPLQLLEHGSRFQRKISASTSRLL